MQKFVAAKIGLQWIFGYCDAPMQNTTHLPRSLEHAIDCETGHRPAGLAGHHQGRDSE
jgi:hypothetical protein